MKNWRDNVATMTYLISKNLLCESKYVSPALRKKMKRGHLAIVSIDYLVYWCNS